MKRIADRKLAMKPYGRITTEQYYSLTPIGKELHDYWMKFKPEMYEEMYQKKTLLPTLISDNARLHEMICELIQNGMSVPQAMEVARAQIYEEIAD